MKSVLIFLGLCFILSGCTGSDNKKKSYAALSEAHKKLADDCMEWADYTSGDPVIRGLDNPETHETRIILNSDQSSFTRCDYKTKSGKRVKAERILGGEIVRTY
jgi:hypothetical protein